MECKSRRNIKNVKASRYQLRAFSANVAFHAARKRGYIVNNRSDSKVAPILTQVEFMLVPLNYTEYNRSHCPNFNFDSID